MLLNKYEQALGQKINREKTSTAFSRNVTDVIQEYYVILGVLVVSSRIRCILASILWLEVQDHKLSLRSKKECNKNYLVGKIHFYLKG